MSRVINAAVIGLGSVHRNLLRILESKRKRLHDEYGLEFRIVCIADSSGIATDPEGFDLPTVCSQKEAGRRVAHLPEHRPGGSATELLERLDCDLVFEATPTNLETGEPALSVTETALGRGIPVVLASKGPLVLAFAKLHRIAERTGAALRYSATVCGGLPVVNIGRRDLVAAEIHRLRGVFNSTTNFVLSAMAEGTPYDEALQETQRRGIAETDPSLDVGGWDTANKLIILVNSLLREPITLRDIEVTGIEAITPELLQAEAARGNTIKLVASADGGSYTVRPTALPNDDFLAQCSGWEMAVELHTDIYGIQYHKLWEREPIPTAAAMLRDAVDIFRKASA